jgi:iron complex outermembrane receptor protein
VKKSDGEDRRLGEDKDMKGTHVPRSLVGALSLCCIVDPAMTASAAAQVIEPTAPQVAAAAPADAPAPTVSGDIVVTARRSSERLQDVPVAVTAISEAQLEAIKPRTLQDLSGLAPNVSIGQSGGGGASAALFIRGLGYADIEKGQSPAVALLIDDVVIGPNTGQLIDAFDIQQVEINRGPQGIFYGKNTIAGAVSIRRSRPTKEWGVRGSVGTGNYGQFTGRVIGNAPLGEDAGIKIGISHRRRDGFLNNIYTGDDSYGDDRLTTGTIALDWNVTPSLTALLSGDFTRQTGQGTPVQFNNFLAARLLAGSGLAFNEIGSPYIPGVTRPLKLRETAADFPDENYLSQQRYSLNLDWQSQIGDIVSITAYIGQRDRVDNDFDGSCGVTMLSGKPCPVITNPFVAVLHTTRPQRYTQFTQETRISNTLGPVKLMAGVYYFDSVNRATQLSANGIPGVPADAYSIGQFSREKNESLSGFANADLNLGGLQLSAGARYLHETKDFQNQFDLLYAPNAGPVDTSLVRYSGDRTWNRWLTRFAANYKISPDMMVYASRSEGFRSGGFAPRGTLSEASPGQTNYSPGANYSEFEPETNVAYEVGSKNTLWNRQITLNLAAFYTKDKDHQATSFVLTPGYGPGSNTYVVNIPELKIKGLESELTLRPRAIHGLTILAQAAYLHSEITKGLVPGVQSGIGPNGQGGAPGSVFDQTGTPLERAPKYSYSIRGDYTHNFGPGEIGFNLGYKWQSRFVLGTSTLLGQYDYQSSYGTMDGSLSYQLGRYKIVASAKNLTKKDYRDFSLPTVFYSGWSEPRTFFVELQFDL